MRNLLLLFFIVGLAYSAQSQSRLLGDRSVYTQYFMTPFLLNPGATGQKEYGQVIANYRNAWASFPGSPRTVTVGYDGAIGNRIGLGIVGMSDSFAGFGTSKGVLSLSYAINTPTNKLGFGLSAEYVQHTLKSEAVTSQIYDNTDPAVLARLDGSSYFDGSIGVYGEYMDKVIYGVALPTLLSTRLDGVGDDTADSDISYIAHVGYRLRVPEKDIVFEPSIWVKKLKYVPFHVDINLKADFLNEQLTAGLIGSVGAEERIGFLVGTQVSNFGFHYTYNVSLHQFQEFNNGSHELGLKLRLNSFSSAEAPSDN